MRGWRKLLVPLLVSLAASGCASGSKAPDTASKMAFAPETTIDPTGNTSSGHFGSLAGRTMHIRSASDIRLAPKEVVLTFDDGPIAGKTDKVLAILAARGVKATFLMVGQMARAYPATARKVAAAGHSIGSHTQDHANLRGMSTDRAFADIEAGRQSIAAALGPSLNRPANFFRFPYLADTPALRRQLALHNIAVIDADIDSKDYFPSSPAQVEQRILAKLGKRGSGIILMHDIHPRTIAMLPGLLDALKARGYKVVHLAPASRLGPFVSSLSAEMAYGYGAGR